MRRQGGIFFDRISDRAVKSDRDLIGLRWGH